MPNIKNLPVESGQFIYVFFFAALSPSVTLPTCVLQHKSIAAEGCVAAESQKQGVGAAFDAVWNICTVETAQQGAERVWTIVDVQEIIAGLQAKPGNRRVRDPREDFRVCKHVLLKRETHWLKLRAMT